MQPIPPSEVPFQLAYKAWALVQAAHQQVSQHITDPRKVTAGPWWPEGEPWEPDDDPRENMHMAIRLMEEQLTLIETNYSELGDHL